MHKGMTSNYYVVSFTTFRAHFGEHLQYVVLCSPSTRGTRRAFWRINSKPTSEIYFKEIYFRATRPLAPMEVRWFYPIGTTCSLAVLITLLLNTYAMHVY